MVKKCTKTKHYPNWEDSEIEQDDQGIFVDCNCECWGKCYRRDYECVNEYEVDTNV